MSDGINSLKLIGITSVNRVEKRGTLTAYPLNAIH